MRRASTRTAVVAGLVGVLVAVGVTSAVAAPPDPDAVIDILPGTDHANSVTVTADAVYFTSNGPFGTPFSQTSTLYRRSLTPVAGGSTLGPVELIGRIRTDSAYAVHDGTVAYLRAVDGTLVLRAPDGTEVRPVWGDSEAMAGGIVDMSAEWLVVTDYPYDPVFTLVDRQTGAMYDLASLVTPPLGVGPLSYSWVIDVDDGRAIWGMFNDGALSGYTGVYTVALGAAGPVGSAHLLQGISQPSTGPQHTVLPIGVDGTRVLWEEKQCDTDDCTVWANRSTYPFLAASETNLGDVSVIDYEGSVSIVTSAPTTAGGARLSWYDLGFSSTPVAGLDVTFPVSDVEDLKVAYYAPDHQELLADAYGGTLSGDQTTPPPSMPFSDVGWSDAFTDEILWLYDHGVVGGYSDRTFRGLAPVNRDAMAAFLYRLAHDGAKAPACTAAAFSDVPASHPFCGEIDWLADTGITTGWPDGTFRPATPVTREAMAAFLYRFAHDGGDAPACATKPFSDVAVGNPFCGEVDWMADAGISTGWPDGTFRPTASIERQAMAAFLFRFIDAGLVPAS